MCRAPYLGIATYWMGVNKKRVLEIQIDENGSVRSQRRSSKRWVRTTISFVLGGLSESVMIWKRGMFGPLPHDFRWSLLTRASYLIIHSIQSSMWLIAKHRSRTWCSWVLTATFSTSPHWETTDVILAWHIGDPAIGRSDSNCKLWDQKMQEVTSGWLIDRFNVLDRVHNGHEWPLKYEIVTDDVNLRWIRSDSAQMSLSNWMNIICTPQWDRDRIEQRVTSVAWSVRVFTEVAHCHIDRNALRRCRRTYS